MTLAELLAPTLKAMRCGDGDAGLESFLRFYTENAVMVDISRRKVHTGHQELLEKFAELAKNFDWIPTTSDEEYSGGEELIRYESKCTLRKEEKIMIVLKIVQFWRKIGDEYKMEVEFYTVLEDHKEDQSNQ
ncbi:unnamed protein product, partial [Mesorhabditis belari]|uniref:Nuclear transport factor 2 family protein n=1 Tax=Mesorhabditis belari TaxID=2138241 RepID=A0AAF3FKD8_9BILA